MSAKYEELIEAGAPRLPEGYYYKIRERSGTPRYLHVWVRRERRGWFDATAGWTCMFVGAGTDLSEIADLCRRAYAKAFSGRLPAHLMPFIGRHP